MLLVSCNTKEKPIQPAEDDSESLIKIEHGEESVEFSKETMEKAIDLTQKVGEKIGEEIEANRDLEVKELELQLDNARKINDFETREKSIMKVIDVAIDKKKYKHASKWIKYLKDEHNQDVMRERINETINNN